ncbi:hypothetical protein B6S12_10065, partial [Helicobacter valdiviensis]
HYSDSVLENIRNKHGSDDFKIDIVGHSLGEALTQMLALSLCDDKNRNNIKALYTYNVSLESRSIAY